MSPPATGPAPHQVSLGAIGRHPPHMAKHTHAYRCTRRRVCTHGYISTDPIHLGRCSVVCAHCVAVAGGSDGYRKSVMLLSCFGTYSIRPIGEHTICVHGRLSFSTSSGDCVRVRAAYLDLMAFYSTALGHFEHGLIVTGLWLCLFV